MSGRGDFRYFAYGSNLWPPRMTSRCPSAEVVGTARLDGWAPVYDKPGADGTAKLNIRPEPDSSVEGVVYEIDDADRASLDAAEPRYTPIEVVVDGEPTLTYTYEGAPHDIPPAHWYVATVSDGAHHHGLDPPLPPS